MSQLKGQSLQITRALQSARPHLPSIFFYTAQATSLTDDATRKLRREMLRKYGEDIIAPSSPQRAMSAGEQYETNLLPHAEYATFHEADARIMHHYQHQLKTIIGGNLVFDLGYGNGDTTTELVRLTKPGQYFGVDILSGLQRRLKSRLHAYLPMENLRIVQDDYYNPDFWKDAERDLARRRTANGRVIFVNLGLGVGNADDAMFGNQLEYMRPCMKEGDILYCSNDAMGTYGLKKYDVAAERQQSLTAYSPPGSRPYLHYVVHVAFKIASLRPLDHSKATASITFDDATSRIQRKLVLDTPHQLIIDSEIGNRPVGVIAKEIELMHSYKRSLEEMNIHAKFGGMKLDPTYILPDPSPKTRIAWVPFTPVFRTGIRGHTFS